MPPISRKRSVLPTSSATSDHEEATLEEKVFERLPVKTRSSQHTSAIWTAHNVSAIGGNILEWSSESSVAAYVRFVLEHLFFAASFNDLTCHQELSLFDQQKPDIVIICEFDVPIGVVEVKTSAKTSPLSKEKVLGQVFDYLVHLKNYTGRRDVFGILTTYHEWRVVWLPECDEAARSTETTPAANHNSQSPIAQLPDYPPNWSDPDKPNRQYLPNIPSQDSQTSRHLFGTHIIEWNDPDLPHILLSVIHKMRLSPMNPVSYFTLSPRRWYIYLTEDCFRWEKVAEEIKPVIEGKVPSRFQHAFLLADLGGGGDGRVWLACTRAGKVCVLKFSRNGDQLEEEKQIWKKAWNCDVLVKRLNKRPVLIMPWVKSCSEKEFHRNEEVKAAVKDAIKTMASVGYMHDDLRWRHVGLYRKDGKLHALLFDLSRATPINRDQASIEHTISQMMSELDIQDN